MLKTPGLRGSGSRVIDQREVQRRGGVCAKTPTACIVAEILGEAGLEPRRLVVLDLTYGEGRFWAAARPGLLIAGDIRVVDWVVEPDVFLPGPAWRTWRLAKRLGLGVDVVAVDPPWVGRASRLRRHHGLDLALGAPTLILKTAVEAAENLGARHILAHYRERWAPRGWRIVVEKWWRPVTRYMNAGTTWWGLLSRAED